MHIIPAILTADIATLRLQLDTFTPCCNRIHIDIQDGTQTRTKTLSHTTILPILQEYPQVIFDIHWMSSQPIPTISKHHYYIMHTPQTYTHDTSCIYMTVPVGPQGQRFDPEMYDAIPAVSATYKEKLIDGGIDAHIITTYATSIHKIDGIVVGSYFTHNLTLFTNRLTYLQQLLRQY